MNKVFEIYQYHIGQNKWSHDLWDLSILLRSNSKCETFFWHAMTLEEWLPWWLYALVWSHDLWDLSISQRSNSIYATQCGHMTFEIYQYDHMPLYGHITLPRDILSWRAKNEPPCALNWPWIVLTCVNKHQLQLNMVTWSLRFTIWSYASVWSHDLWDLSISHRSTPLIAMAQWPWILLRCVNEHQHQFLTHEQIFSPWTNLDWG